MSLITDYKLATEPAEIQKVKAKLEVQVTKECYLIKDLKTKAAAIQKEIEAKTKEMKSLLASVEKKEGFVGEAIETIGKNLKLPLKFVEVSCKLSEAVEVVGSFNKEGFVKHEVSVICNTVELLNGLKTYASKTDLILKDPKIKVDKTLLKKHLKSFPVEGAKIVNNRSLTYKFK